MSINCQRLIKFVPSIAIAATVLASTGCGAGHGRYTKEHQNAAAERLRVYKAGAEYEMATTSFLAGDLDKALKMVDEAIELAASIPKCHILRGRVLLEMSNLEGASNSFKVAEALQPDNVDSHYYQGIILERVAKKQDALDRYLRAAEIDPSNAQYAVAASEMMIDLGQIDKAEKYLQDNQQVLEHNAGVRQALGHIALMKDDPAKAAELFQQARMLAPDDLILLEDVVNVQLELGQFAQAEYNITKLLEEPDNEGREDLTRMHIRCLIEVDRPVEARELLLELTSKGPGSGEPSLWIELGNVAYTLRDMSRVRVASSRAIALAPHRPDGYMLRALWQHKQGKRDEALKSLEAALQRDRNTTDALILGGMILEEQGKFEAAQRAFAEVVNRDPGNEVASKLLRALDQHQAVATVDTDGD